MENKEIMYELKKVSPGWAIFWSVIITGGGHFYIGKIGKGFLLLIIQILLWFVLLGWVMWFIAPVSAYNDAKLHNKILQLEIFGE